MLFSYAIVTPNFLAVLSIVLAVIFSVLQAFDVISTNLVISKGRGYEANGIMGKWQAFAGRWWWTIKLPLVAFVWFIAIGAAGNSFAAAMLVLAVAGYAYVIWNNYRIAWRLAP